MSSVFDFNEIYKNNLKCFNILVLGDIIYDNYLFCNTNRISPEAPVPILKPHKEEFKLGGAANVFNNIIALGAKASLCGVTGDDPEGMKIKSKLISLDNTPELIFTDSNRPTSKKTRVMVGTHHLLRIDDEKTDVISEEIERTINDTISKKIDSYNLLVISDYNKGVLKHSLVQNLIKIFTQRGKIVIADPKCDFYKYSGAYLIKPNINELTMFIGNPSLSNNWELLNKYCKPIFKKGNFKYIYTTLGEKGGILLKNNGGLAQVSAFGKKAVDITGAGDVTIAALAIAMAAKIDINKAVNFASFAAGISVSKMGTSIVEKSEIITLIEKEIMI